MGHLTEMLLLFVLIAASSAFEQGSCPNGWSRIGSRCFHYFAQPVDWATAEGYCLNMDANLVSVHSETEYQALKALIRTYDYQENPTWLGLSNCQKTHNWFWSDGTKFYYRKWNTNEPNHKKGECCAQMNYGAEKNWNDNHCHLKFSFVCTKRVE